jgi:hypothetical protein
MLWAKDLANDINYVTGNVRSYIGRGLLCTAGRTSLPPERREHRLESPCGDCSWMTLEAIS